jgi:hypothetical protein
MAYSAVDDLHRRYMYWIMTPVGERWYKQHSDTQRTSSGWLPCNKITFIHSSAFVGLFKNFIHLIKARNMGHIKLNKQVTLSVRIPEKKLNVYAFVKEHLNRMSVLSNLLHAEVITFAHNVDNRCLIIWDISLTQKHARPWYTLHSESSIAARLIDWIP